MTKREKIRVLLTLTQNSEVVDQGYRKLIMSMPENLIPNFSVIKQKLIARFDSLMEKVMQDQVDAHDKFLSEAAIDGAIEYYLGPAGKEILAARPKIDEELVKKCSYTTAELSKEIIDEILSLGCSEDDLNTIMKGMGFVRVDPDSIMESMGPLLENILGNVDFEDDGPEFPTSTEEPKPKKTPIEVDDKFVSEDEFDKFSRDWLDKNE